MKIKRSRLIVIAILVIAMVLIVIKLKSNRKERTQEIALSQRQVGKVAVSIDTVQLGTISEKVKATGVLEPTAVLNLVSETQGKIVRKLKQKGDRVNVGDIIVKVDDEVVSANVLMAEANYEQSQKDNERLSRLASQQAVTKHDLEQSNIGLKKAKADLVSARKSLSNTSIKAPISGYINNDFITVGQFLSSGTPVCEIVNNNTLKINIKITEQEVYKINIGQTVTVRLSAFPGKSFSGHITSIAEKADATMKFNVEVALSNTAQLHLKSGLYAEVEFPVKNEEKLIIHKAAITGSMESPSVFVVVNGKAEKRDIVIGQSTDSQVEVLQGLRKGDILVVSGQLNLKIGNDVKIVK